MFLVHVDHVCELLLTWFHDVTMTSAVLAMDGRYFIVNTYQLAMPRC